MFLSGVKRKKYIFEKEKLIRSITDMKNILNIYKNIKNEDELDKYIISLNLNECRIRDILGSYYPISEIININPPEYLKNTFEENKKIVDILEKEKDAFYNEFYEFLCISSDFYKKAFKNNFIDYPYDLINEEVKKIIIYSFSRGMFDY